MSLLGLGPTGHFPDGKLTPDDDGEIKIAISAKDGNVIMAFGVAVEWIAFPKAQALAIATALITHATHSD